MLGAVLAVTSILAAIPQPLSLLRDRTQDLSGLSQLRWRLAAGAYASWFWYGVATGQAAVWLSSSVALISALIVCTLLVLRNAALAAPVPAGVPAARGVARVRPATDFPTMVIPAGWLASRKLVGAAA